MCCALTCSPFQSKRKNELLPLPWGSSWDPQEMGDCTHTCPLLLQVQPPEKVIYSFFLPAPSTSGKTSSGCHGDQPLTSECLCIKDGRDACRPMGAAVREPRCELEEVTNFKASSVLCKGESPPFIFGLPRLVFLIQVFLLFIL